MPLPVKHPGPFFPQGNSQIGYFPFGRDAFARHHQTVQTKKDKREQTSFRIKTPGETRKGAFKAISTTSFQTSSVDQNTEKKLMRIPQWILYPPTKFLQKVTWSCKGAQQRKSCVKHTSSCTVKWSHEDKNLTQYTSTWEYACVLCI